MVPAPTEPVAESTPESDIPPEAAGTGKGLNLFASATESCFFRRPEFSPDGAILVTPMGVYTPAATGVDGDPAPSYCTHVFSREGILHSSVVAGSSCAPIYSLVGLDEPSVAVRFNPRLFVPMTGPEGASMDSVIRGKYRLVLRCGFNFLFFFGLIWCGL